MKVLQIVLLLLPLLCGCGSVPSSTPGEENPFTAEIALDQEYPLAHVFKRFNSIRPGMRRTDVLLILGRPRYITQNLWTYQPVETPAFKALDTVEVLFEGDRVLRIQKGAMMIGVGGG